MDIASVLENAILGRDASVRSAAEQQLQNAAQSDFPQYLAMLNQVFGDDSQRAEVRILAGIGLKNLITSKDYRVAVQQAERWLNVDAGLRYQIKECSLRVLDTSVERVAANAAQLVAAIAEVELPVKEWPQLTSALVEKTGAEQAHHVKRAALKAIGYICETADPSNAGVLEQADGFLTAIVQGAQTSEADPTRLTALNALVLSLEFIKLNFAVDAERDCIMQVVCEATQSNNTEVQAAAFGALGRIAAIYYQYMLSYMERALFGLTIAGMQSLDENVACMAVEFWSTVCEEELEIMADHLEFADTSRSSYNFAVKASEQVVPTLLTLLTKQDESADEDEWSAAMAAGACLQLFAADVKDSIVGPVLEFVNQNINSDSWVNREASVMAFGSILDGPDPGKMGGVLNDALATILNLMNDSSFQVKDTTAWCLGRMIQFMHGTIDVDTQLLPLAQALVKGLKDHPKVMANCSWAIINLSDSMFGVDTTTSPLSPFYPDIVSALLEATTRPDNEYSCRTSAYEALSALVKDAADDTFSSVIQITPEVLNRLHQTIGLQSQVVNSDDRINLEELQSNLLGLLTCIIRRADREVASGADNLMELFFTLLQNKLPNSLIEEDVYIAIGAVAGAVGVDFAKYMNPLMPTVISGLRDEMHPCNGILVGMFADICSALGPQVGPYCEPVMEIFVQALADQSIPQEVKPTMLSCIGDVASALGLDFVPYLTPCMPILVGASSMQAGPEASPELQDYVYQLRASVVDAYVGIVAGLHGAPNALQMVIGPVFNFVKSLYQTDVLTVESNVKSVIGLLGDLADIFPPGQLREELSQPWITEIIKSGRNPHYLPSTRDTARWARERQKRQIQ